MKTKDKRYITLFGDDIQDKNLAKQILKSDSTLAAGSAVGLDSFLQTAIFQDDFSLSSAIFVFAFNELIVRNRVQMINPYILFNTDINKTCIDKYPSPEQSATSISKYGIAINDAKERFKFTSSIVTGSMSCIAGAFTVAGLVTGSQSPMETQSFLSTMFTNTALLVSTDASAWHRFNKLAKGDWAIVDMPEGRKQQYVEKEWFKSPTFTDAPEAT